jgi:two-component system NarL family sensor kinase
MPWRSPSASRSSIKAFAAAAAGAACAAAVARARHRRAAARLSREAGEREAEHAWLSAQVITAEQEERRRLSLALHDGPLQSLSGIALMHDAALKALRSGRVDEAVTVLESALGRERATISTLRDLSFALEPVVLRDQGFGAAVSALADQLAAATGIPVMLSLEPAEALGEKAQVALYQTIREALDQAVRRRPSRISIAVDRDPDGGFRTVIADDGVRERRRATADAIAERVRILGGRVAIDGTDGGTTVCVTLPAYVASV